MESALLSMGASAGTAATVSGIAGTAMTGFSLLSGIQSGYAQEAAMKQQAEGVKEQKFVEKLKAQEESNLRRERLLNALAAQNVKAGAGGVKGGTTEQLKLQSVDAYSREQGAADIMSSSTQSRLQRKAEGLVAEGKQLRRQSLMSTATKLADIG